MNLLEGMTFFFDLTVPATLAVVALLFVIALWSPFLSTAKQNTGYRLRHNRTACSPSVLVQPQRTAGRQLSDQRALRYWNTRLDIEPATRQTDRRGGGQVIAFRRTKLQ